MSGITNPFCRVVTVAVVLHPSHLITVVITAVLRSNNLLFTFFTTCRYALYSSDCWSRGASEHLWFPLVTDSAPVITEKAARTPR